MNFDARRPVQLSSGETCAPHETWPVRSWLSTLVWLLACLTLSLWLTGCGGGDTEPVEPQVSVRVGPAGGTVTGPDGAQVIIPAGALSGTVTIGITRTARGAPATAPEGTVPVDGTYEFTPHDTVFLKPVTLRLPVKNGATGNDVFMASPGGDWQSHEATVSGGFAEWQRNSFSWGYIGLCSIPANNTDPYPCVYTRGYAFASATPPTAITRQAGGYQGNFSGSAGAWLVNEASTVQLTLTYQAPPDCVNPRARLIRVDPTLALSAPNRVTTLLDQAVGLSLITLPPPPGGIGSGGGSTSRQRLAGTTTFDVSFSHADTIANVAGQHVFGFTFSCNRPGKPKMTGGDLMTFTSVVPAPTVTHAIGGSVSGLSGSGLVLQNNGGNDLAISTNGSFSFTTPVGAGAPYAVTVSTQPTGQTCSVANGSGTASGAVNSVAVTCAATGVTHPISGYVTSTASGPVVLQNNGTDTFTVASDTSFTFPTEIPAGAPYNVTVLTPPAGQTCTVDRPSGNAPQRAGFEVQVNCVASPSGGWMGPALRENDSGNLLGQTAEVISDAGGNAFAYWIQIVGGKYSPFVARYTPAGGWSSPLQLDAGTSPAKDLNIALNANGTAMAVWSQKDGTGPFNIWASRFSGGVWAAPVLIENNNLGDANQPKVAINDSGDSFVTWIHNTGSFTYRVMSNRHVAGSWGTEATIDSGGSPNNYARVVALPNGKAVAAWLHFETGTQRIWSSEFNGTNWVTAAPVATGPTAGAGYLTQLKADKLGNAVVMWDSNTSGAYTSRWSAGVWSTPKDLPLLTGNVVQQRNLAMNDVGQVLVAWVENDGSTGACSLRAQVYQPASAWEAPFQLHTAADCGLDLDVALNANGQAVITWIRNLTATGKPDVFAYQGVVGSTTWTGPTLIGNGNTDGVAWGDVTMPGNGQAIAVWEQFEATGQPNTFLVNLWSNLFR